MFSTIYTKGQAEILKNVHGVRAELPPTNGQPLLIVRPKNLGGGLIRLSPSQKRKRGNLLYRIEVLSEQELQAKLEVA